MAPELPLPRLQHWMQAVLVHPGTLEEALADAGKLVPPSRLGEVIRPSATLTSAERVGIYQDQYLLRMEEALATDYPALKHFLGDQRFWELVRAYVQVHPSRSYSLNRLGDHLPAFLAAGGHRLPRPGFCADLARVELAVSQAFDAEETPALAPEVVAAVPAESWEQAVLLPVAALRLLALRYPVSAWIDSTKGEAHEHPPVRRADSWVAVFRRNYAVYRLELSRAGFDLLSAIVAGQPLGAAIATALSRRGRARPGEEELFRCFRDWIASGLFCDVRLA